MNEEQLTGLVGNIEAFILGEQPTLTMSPLDSLYALQDECKRLRARLDAVPVKILREDYHKRFGTRELRWWPEWALPIGRWLFSEVQA